MLLICSLICIIKNEIRSRELDRPNLLQADTSKKHVPQTPQWAVTASTVISTLRVGITAQEVVPRLTESDDPFFKEIQVFKCVFLSTSQLHNVICRSVIPLDRFNLLSSLQ